MNLTQWIVISVAFVLFLYSLYVAVAAAAFSPIWPWQRLTTVRSAAPSRGQSEPAPTPADSFTTAQPQM